MPKFEKRRLCSFTNGIENFLLQQGIESTAELVRKKLLKSHESPLKIKLENTTTNFINCCSYSSCELEKRKLYPSIDCELVKDENNFDISQSEIRNIKNLILGYYENTVTRSVGLFVMLIISLIIILSISICVITISGVGYHHLALIAKIFCLSLVINCFVLENLKILIIVLFKKYFLNTKFFF